MDSSFRMRLGFSTVALTALIVTGPAFAGAVTGVVKYDGAVPTLKPIQMSADPGCAKKHSTPPPSEVLVLGDGNTLGNVLVRVRKGATGTYTAPKTPAVLDQKGCQYVPHVLALMVDQPLLIKNDDGLLHNVHALPEVNQGFNQAMPGSVTEATKSFSKAEPPFKIKCDVHPWMGAYIAVVDNPFHAVTGPDGKFKLNDLPAGTYEIEAWHEKLGTQSASVTISGDATQTTNFTFSPPKR